MFQITDEASNRADWTVQVSATDLETGDAIDFSVATQSQLRSGMKPVVKYCSPHC
jgi:hypothetical protein